MKRQRLFSRRGEKQDLKALAASLQTGGGSERKRANFFFFSFPRTVNNSKSPGSKPARIMLLTQLCYVLRLQNTGWQQVLDTSAPKWKGGVYLIPWDKKKKKPSLRNAEEFGPEIPRRRRPRGKEILRRKRGRASHSTSLTKGICKILECRRRAQPGSAAYLGSEATATLNPNPNPKPNPNPNPKLLGPGKELHSKPWREPTLWSLPAYTPRSHPQLLHQLQGAAKFLRRLS